MTTNPLLDFWRNDLVHQREHNTRYPLWQEDRPDLHCHECIMGRTGREGRRSVVHRWSWAVPDDRALDLIVEHSPDGIVEIGAGTGYWASLLVARGVTVHAYDEHPPDPDSDANEWHKHAAQHHLVARGGPEKVRDHAYLTLFLCWPYMNDMAAKSLANHRGEYVIYIGEDYSGCTADDEFHDELYALQLVAEYQHPTWAGLHDWMRVYRRHR